MCTNNSKYGHACTVFQNSLARQKDPIMWNALQTRQTSPRFESCTNLCCAGRLRMPPSCILTTTPRALCRDYLELRLSGISRAGLGVWATKPVERGTVLGLYGGQIYINAADIGDYTYTWTVSTRKKADMELCAIYIEIKFYICSRFAI